MAHRAYYTTIIAIFIVTLLYPSRDVRASARDLPLPQPAQCVTVITAAMSRNGALYSQGGYLTNDPINPNTGKAYPRTGPNSFDCSGLVWWSYAQAGITIGSTTYQQINNGVQIPCSLADLNGENTVCWSAGDLLFLRYPEGQHVVIYVGSGMFFGCENYSLGCLMHNPKSNSFYQRYFWQARRIISGCGDDVSPQPANPLPADSQPTWEEIPGIASPVRLVLPWFEPNSPELIEPLPDPVFASYDVFGWIQWMGVQLYNRVTIPIVYWLLAGAQMILNAIQAIINTVAVPSINWFWRIIIRVVLWFNSVILAAWSIFESVRYYVWSIFAALSQEILNLLATFGLIQQLINISVDVIHLIGDVIMAAISAITYLFTVIISTTTYVISYVFDILTNNTTQENQQITEVRNSFIFSAFIDTLQGLVDSRLGWFYYACVALFYAQIAVWLIEEAGSSNS